MLVLLAFFFSYLPPVNPKSMKIPIRRNKKKYELVPKDSLKIAPHSDTQTLSLSLTHTHRLTHTNHLQKYLLARP